MAQILTAHTYRTNKQTGARTGMALVAKTSEVVWFCITFVLFLAMGPFSAVPVLIGLSNLGSEEHRARMKEPARV